MSLWDVHDTSEVRYLPWVFQKVCLSLTGIPTEKNLFGAEWHGFIQQIMTTTLVQNQDCKLFIWCKQIEGSLLSIDLCKS